MKRWIFLFILILVVVFGRLEQNLAPSSQSTPLSFPLKVIPTKKYPSLPQTPHPVVSKVAPGLRAPAQTQATFSFAIDLGDEPQKIRKSFFLVKNMAVIEKANYNPSMGERLTETNSMIYFRPLSSDLPAWPVAQEATTERLFPVSHILHVSGVDSTLREQFKAEGLKEFYYHPRMKFISLEATPATVLKQFQDLTARGYDARLEVLKDPHQPK